MNNAFKLLGYTVAALSVLAAACSPIREETDGLVEVTLRLSAEGAFATRSSFTWGESEIRDIQVVVTDEDGNICDDLYASPAKDLHFKGIVGKRYRLWAAANLGGRVTVRTLPDFTAATRAVSAAGIAKSGIPMFNGHGGQEITITESAGTVELKLTRMLARVDLTIDTKRLDNPEWFSVKYAKICNAINTYTTFSTSARQEHFGSIDHSFDYASSADVTRLGSGETVSLYAFENMQGTLLPGNTDPWKKVPANIGNAGDYCTYLEVGCTYGSGDNDVTYRMYLGHDATTNFDVERNTIYSVTLVPTEKEIRGDKGSWKVEAEPWREIVDIELFLNPSVLELSLDEGFREITSRFLVTYDDGSTEEEEAYSYWAADGDALSYIEPARWTPLNSFALMRHVEVKGIASGQATVTANASYFDSEYYASCDITVLEPSTPDPGTDPDPEPDPDPDPDPEPDPEPDPGPDPEPVPVPTLYADITELDTWGGNEYRITIFYDDDQGHVTDVTTLVECPGVYFTGGIPSDMLDWEGNSGSIVAEDWWGLSGRWVTSSPTYLMTLSYKGLSVEIGGTMHGYTRAEVEPEKPDWHYTEIEDNGWSGPAATVTLYGSETTILRTTDTHVINPAGYTLPNGYLGLGSGIPFHAEFTDPSNGYTREGDSEFDIVTNVSTLTVAIRPSFAQYGEGVDLVTETGTDGEFLGSSGILVSDMTVAPYYVSISQDIWYEDYKGETHQLTFYDGKTPESEIVDLSGGWSLKSEWQENVDEGEIRTIELNVNGFSASWRWGYLGNL